jgi:hypothetical protein
LSGVMFLFRGFWIGCYRGMADRQERSGRATFEVRGREDSMGRDVYGALARRANPATECLFKEV